MHDPARCFRGRPQERSAAPRRRRSPAARPSGSRGFTLVELLVTLAVFAVLALLGYPALMNMLERQKMISTTHEAASVMRLARFTAVKRSIDVKVTADYVNDVLVAYRDVNNDNVVDPTDETIATAVLPKNVFFWGPPDAAAEGAAANTFPAATVTFQPAGSASDDGAFRLRGKNPDYFEVAVEQGSQATGRVSIRKWGGGDVLTDWWQNGEAGRQWVWNG